MWRFWTPNLCHKLFPSRLSRSALDGERGLDLVGFTVIDRGLSAFVIKRLDDYFEFSIAIQIKHRSNLVHVRSDGLVGFRINFTSDNLRLNLTVDYTAQDDDGITSALRSVHRHFVALGKIIRGVD